MMYLWFCHVFLFMSFNPSSSDLKYIAQRILYIVYFHARVHVYEYRAHINIVRCVLEHKSHCIYLPLVTSELLCYKTPILYD